MTPRTRGSFPTSGSGEFDFRLPPCSAQADLPAFPLPLTRVVTVIATALCFDVGLSSSIITGGLVPVKEHFHSSTEVVNLTVCVFVIGFGVGPLFLSPMSELLGRKCEYPPPPLT